jgi:hypothetical protein
MSFFQGKTLPTIQFHAKKKKLYCKVALAYGGGGKTYDQIDDELY